MSEEKPPMVFPDATEDWRDFGLTKREWFAGMALQGLMSQDDTTPYPGEATGLSLDEWRQKRHENNADYCFRTADAMLKSSQGREGK